MASPLPVKWSPSWPVTRCGRQSVAEEGPAARACCEGLATTSPVRMVLIKNKQKRTDIWEEECGGIRPLEAHRREREVVQPPWKQCGGS